MNIFSGVCAMEIIAMEMKTRGVYIARQLSFNDVKYEIEEALVSGEFKKTYDFCVQFVSLFLYNSKWA